MSNNGSRPDPSSAAGGAGSSSGSPFGGLEAGLSFFQDWMKAAGSALPNLQAAQGSGGSSTWGLPTLDPEELDKRIQDLRTVQFWLEQNARMIAMTIQGLEVQRMTLTTLRGMNVSMDAVRESLKARAASAASAAAPTPAPEPEPASDAQADAQGAAEPTVNPMKWWNTLTEQFSQMASQAVQAAKVVPDAAASADSAPAAARQPRAAQTTSKPATKRTAASKPAAKAARSTKTTSARTKR